MSNPPLYNPREPLISNNMAITLNGFELIPTPFISISQQSEYRENGEIKTITKQIDLKGKIIAVDPVQGEQEPIGTNYEIDKHKLALIRDKIKSIELALTHDTDEININTSINGPHLSGKFKLKSKNFQINEASLVCDYTISLEQIVLDTQEPDETWSLDPADEYNRFVKINRSRSIQVKSAISGSPPIENDYKLAMDKIALTTSIADASKYFTLPTENSYNKTTSYSVNVYKNTVDCNESWILSKDPFIIEQTYTTKESFDSAYKSASLQGNITGYEGNGKTKYQNALDKFNLIKDWTIGQTYLIGDISGKLRSVSIGTNKISGSITYSLEVLQGIEKENERFKSVTWTDNPPIDTFSVIPAIGKEVGPIIQKISSKKNGVKTVNIEVLYNDGSRTPPDVSSYAPIATEIFVEKDDMTFDYKTKKVTRSVVWNYN
ncbi:hypothetical protein EBU24_01135 [bacterium]|nr:hypothetical protein [bacterium]